jgi:tRNA(Ile)-lysidine synthase
MSLTVVQLTALVEARLPAACSGVVVALSGGADSAALLAALAVKMRWPLRAVHVDHALQSAAQALRGQCVEQTQRLAVPLTVSEVTVSAASGESLEASARQARYRSLADSLRLDECLLTAHHAEDQAETWLLQALRGAGLKGLSAMPWIKPLGSGWHIRPLLEVARADLLALGATLGATGRSDPMNEDLRFDRNYLRLKVWPQLLGRWPGARVALTRSARHVADAQQELEQQARADLSHLRDGEALLLPALRALGTTRRLAAVRRWLNEATVEVPSQARLTEALRQMFEAHPKQLPCVKFGVHALRRYRQRLFVTAASPPRLAGENLWQLPGPLSLGDLGRLQAQKVYGGLDPNRLGHALSVRARRGGESLKVGGGARTHTLQHLCQEHGVLPWLRDALPLLFCGDELLAVADIWLNAGWCVAANEPGVGFSWVGGPQII